MSTSHQPTSTRELVLSSRTAGFPVLSGEDATFKLQTSDLPTLNPGQVLLKTLYLSNDPAQRMWISPDVKEGRLYTTPVQIGARMRARGVAEVLDSRSEKLPVGTLVTAPVGWAEYAVLEASECNVVVPLPGGRSPTHYLGALGLPGITAYYGLNVIGEAQPSDVVVVSGAAGATGSMAVQIAKKMLGCRRVIGIAGSDAKCRWVESLGADICLNYNSPDFPAQLEAATSPDHVDLYFDNVGGQVLDHMLGRMARNARVAACGAISSYNSATTVLNNYFEVITMRLQIRGFIVTDYMKNAPEVLNVFRKAIEEGKLDVSAESEQVVEARLEDVPHTWMKLFEGGNTGKLITKLII